MATIKVLDQESTPLDGVSVFVYDSLGKKVGGIATNTKGEGIIPDTWLSDKNGEIRLSRVGYNPSNVKISDFRGIMYLGKKETTLQEVIIVRKTPKKLTIKNPFEDVPPTPPPVATRKKAVVAKVVGGGILLGLLTLLTFKANK